ncbi:hypothetical protein D3C81_2010170 [compost metagenome]
MDESGYLLQAQLLVEVISHIGDGALNVRVAAVARPLMELVHDRQKLTKKLVFQPHAGLKGEDWNCRRLVCANLPVSVQPAVCNDNDRLQISQQCCRSRIRVL